MYANESFFIAMEGEKNFRKPVATWIPVNKFSVAEW